MCALFGWLDYKHIVPYRFLKKLTQALANAAEERGTDAAGISYIRDGKVIIYKRPKPAHKIKFNIPEHTVAVMGHTRLATQGDKENNYNNHRSMVKLTRLFPLLTTEYCTTIHHSASPVIFLLQRLEQTVTLRFSS